MKSKKGKFYRTGPCCAFPVTDDRGEHCAFVLRGPDTKQSLGELKRGVFRCNPAVFQASEVVCVTEAPIDALSIAAAGFAAIATGGSNCPEWLGAALSQVRGVILAFDSDDGGLAMIKKLAPEITGVKLGWLDPAPNNDWNEMLTRITLPRFSGTFGRMVQALQLVTC